MAFNLVDFVMFNGSTTACYAATAQAEIIAIQNGTCFQIKFQKKLKFTSFWIRAKSIVYTFAFSKVSHLNIESAGRAKFQLQLETNETIINRILKMM